MICPKCDGELVIASVGPQQVHVCECCGGLWLRYGQMKILLELWSRGIDLANPKHQVLPGQDPLFTLNPDQIMGFCPVCQPRQLMLPETRNIGAPVRIDYCQRGHGLWLDAPEIRQIQSRIRDKGPGYPDYISLILLADQEAA